MNPQTVVRGGYGLFYLPIGLETAIVTTPFGGGNGIAFLDPAGIRDIYNIRLERSVGSFDVPQRFVMTAAVGLPFGKGKGGGEAAVVGVD